MHARPRLRFTILGCGSSPGTPRIHGDWGDCDPNNPKNRRLRSALLVEQIGAHGVTRAVIDTGPDFRQQMLNAGVPKLDAAIYTHPHADHTHGIDDLRGFALVQRQRIPVFADDDTYEKLWTSFGYCFETPLGSMYPPILERHTIVAGKPIAIAGEGGTLHALPVKQTHGTIHSLGFRFADPSSSDFTSGGLAYSSDISGLPDLSVALLKNLDIWIVDALQYRDHISHFSLEQSLDWIAKLNPKRAILTHMHIPLDYETVSAQTPDHVEPAYDGMVIEIG